MDGLTGSQAVIAGLTLGLPAGLLPGPMTALVVSQTLRFGLGEGLRVALAPVFTDGPMLLLSASLATVAMPWLGPLSWVGAGVLVLLARDTFYAAPPSADLSGEAPRSWFKALSTNFANPHPWVFWLTIGGPTVARMPTWLDVVGFVCAFFVALVSVKVGMAWMVSRWREALTGQAWRVVTGGLAAALLMFAVYFVWDGWHRMTTWG